MKTRWLLPVIPLSLGLAVAFLAASGLVPNPILRIRVDVATVLIAGLVIVTLGLFTVVAVDHRHQHRLQQTQTQAVQQAITDRRRFLQRLDHELKNPLTAIRAGLANLSEAPTPEAVASVEAQVRRISRLTADLRKLAELETRPLEKADVDLSALLTQVVELAQDRPEAEQRRLNLVLPQAPWPLPHCTGDRDLLLLAIHNILDNALKFTRPNDTIEVRASEDGQVVLIEIADTGPGIPDDDLPHVWEELYRGSSARGVPGSGLGLALVQAILQRHRGEITVRSRAGLGTVFSLRLPQH